MSSPIAPPSASPASHGSPSVPRDANLDLLRAAAIVLVLVYHVVGMWPVEQPLVRRFAVLGKHGVDLFFVLSGFLIGGLYFRELQQRGHVEPLTFWLRRAIRTMPPYFVALAAVYAAVWSARRDPFDPAYLWFGQNYRPQLPFFQASWSLCVEEHAYVAMVLGLGWLATRQRMIGPVLVGACLSAAAMPLLDGAVSRWSGWPSCETATHLWFGGIAVGVLAGWMRVFREPLWQRVRAVCARIWPVPLTIACLMALAGPAWQPWVPSAMAGGCAAVLAAVADRAPLPLATARLTRAIAVASYSTYLTHGLVIHVGRMLRTRFPQVPDPVMFVVWIALIAGVAAVFYRCVERTSISVRDRLVPRPGGRDRGPVLPAPHP